MGFSHNFFVGLGRDGIFFLWEWDGRGLKIHSHVTLYSQVIAKVWSEIREGATQRGGANQTFAAPKFLLAVQLYLLFIIDQHK